MPFKSTATEKRRLAQSGKPYAPHKYQKKAIKFLLEQSAAALFLDPGLGKTSIVYAAFSFLLKKEFAKGMLVVAPLRACQLVWPKEREKWQDFQHLDVVVVHGKDKASVVQEKHDVYVINYEGLDWLVKSGALLTLLKKGFVDILVWDELTKMKNSGGKRFRLIKPWLYQFGRRWGLTGSPASNGLLNLFGQCYVLDGGKALGKFVTQYRAQFFTPVGLYHWKPAPGAEKLIYERLKPLSLRMDADDLVEMPKEIPHRILYTLPKDARKQYEELEEEFFTVIDTRKITAVNTGVVSGKLRQICSGALYIEDGYVAGAPGNGTSTCKPYIDVHDAKLDAFEDLVDSLNGNQVFVCYAFQHDVDRAERRFGPIPYIGGGIDKTLAAEYEAAWNSGKLPWLWGHPQSVGHALNLQGSSAYNVIFYTVPWDFELYDQFIRRLRRQGNTAQFLNVYHMVAENSVEERVMMSLLNKDRTQKALFDALRNRRALNVDYDPIANALKIQQMASAVRKKLGAAG